MQRLLGAVAPATQGVKHLLEQVGFRHVDRIDPFDGGPHYEAKVEDVTLVRAYRRLRLAARELAAREHEPVKLVGVERGEGKARFRAVCAQVRVDGDDALLPRDARAVLQAEPGERVHVIPFE